ncbi:Ferredoxin [Methanosarcina mazei Tuc01]|uniref:Ferredoxin n=7 Tax=Methanosarcina mazei TaxID=2209 RepID=M1Q190_METMZ|nr:Ferredoxin [Methanosarcina mazei Tuc01]
MIFMKYNFPVPVQKLIYSSASKGSLMSEMNGYVVVFGCKRCGKCRDVCPVGAIYEENELAKIDTEKCNLCMKCIDECTNRSIIYME